MQQQEVLSGLTNEEYHFSSSSRIGLESTESTIPTVKYPTAPAIHVLINGYFHNLVTI